MKTLILTISLAVAATFASAQKPGSASDKDTLDKKSAIEVAVLQHKSDQLTLLMEKEPGELVKIKVYEDNKILYSQRVKKEASARITYDISNFPNGNYVVEVIKDKDVVYKAEVSKGSVALAGNQ
jgi:hypothetical protein